MKRIKKMLNICVIVLIILLCIRLYIDHNWIKITSYDVVSEKIPESFNGFKIVQLSDLHSKDFGNQIFNKIDNESPDIIVITGDMVSANQTDYHIFLDFAKKLAEKYKVYYVKGNHEGELSYSNYKVIEDALKLYGITILDNEKIKIGHSGDYINLYGMWVNQRYYSRADIDKEYVVKEETIKKFLGDVNSNEYNILLMHNPLYFDAYVKWGADLVLSGHVHGGLIRLPFLGGVFSPERKFFPEYCYGRFEKDNTTMLISSGLSKGATGFRLFNRPEIVSVTLKRK